jgi:hypothetical protein
MAATRAAVTPLGAGGSAHAAGGAARPGLDALDGRGIRLEEEELVYVTEASVHLVGGKTRARCAKHGGDH